MRVEEAFVQAILASPEDDTPRLVFADWLEETSRHLGGLTTLTLAGNKIGDCGALALAAWKATGPLTTLLMQANSISEPGREALWERFGRRVCRFA